MRTFSFLLIKLVVITIVLMQVQPAFSQSGNPIHKAGYNLPGKKIEKPKHRGAASQIKTNLTDRDVKIKMENRLYKAGNKAKKITVNHKNYGRTTPLLKAYISFNKTALVRGDKVIQQIKGNTRFVQQGGMVNKGVQHVYNQYKKTPNSYIAFIDKVTGKIAGYSKIDVKGNYTIRNLKIPLNQMNRMSLNVFTGVSPDDEDLPGFRYEFLPYIKPDPMELLEVEDVQMAIP